ncbi:PA domain-containing protein [Formosa haliotis]|uniref:PA domain-containing protein n=1 Tax=Formosa haliotis TaxID=1555194 RepID=UPI000824F6A4|nr:PA domain-containing protein [Formosa haliotis]
MKKKLPIVLGLLALTLILAFSYYYSSQKAETEPKTSISELKAAHKKFLENSPFKGTQDLSKKERVNMGLPPKRYMERLWELTMNPELGRPTPENLAVIQKELIAKRNSDLAQGRVPGDASNNNWVERGPNNIGGRTRALIFDPNDASNETVFAGGVSGGLWRNTKISDPNSVWTSVNIPENLNITCITVDPNNSKVMYLGTGESYVSGDVNGNGVWKSTDGGNSWSHIFGGPVGETIIQTSASVVINAPNTIAGTNVASSASFGPKPLEDITSNLVIATDGTALPNEGCNALTNAAAIKGKIALVYRGSCDFVVKVKNAQNAGAIGVIVINNVAGNPIGMGGDDPLGDIKIPAVMISNTNGAKIKAQIDAGNTVNGTIKGGYGDFVGQYVLNGNQHVNDIAVRNNNGVSEVYIAAGATGYFVSNPTTVLGPNDYGLYKSVDGGASWAELGLPTTDSGYKFEPNDIEIGPDNTVWVATRRSALYGDGGGTILSSKDGGIFTVKHTLAARRTQIAVSSTDANKIYVLAEGTNVPVIIEKTTNGFATTTSMPLPNDADDDISADDFCRGQAYYNLVIKLDPKNDETVFVGGIDLFKSVNGGNAWTQLSHWHGGYDLPEMHADQHAIVFGQNDTSKMLFGNDGGVYYSTTSGTNPEVRNDGYNVTQFYTVAVSPTSPFTEELMVAGSQDNGSQFFQQVSEGINSTFPVYGGDGGATFFDQDGTDTYCIVNYVYNLAITKIDYATGARTTINEEEEQYGEFINPQALDSRLDYLFSNYSKGNDYAYRTYRTKLAIGQPGFLVNTIKNDALDASATAMAVSPHQTTGDHSILYLGLENGKLLKVTNASAPLFQTWTDISSPQFLGSISDIEFGQTSNDIFVTFHNYGVNNIWYTTDGGTTWSQKDGNLPDLPVKAILQNPLKLDEVVVGTELGVWYTANFSSNSPTWKSAFNGMSNVKVLDLDMRDNNTIYAATYGRGVFSGKFTSASLSVEDNVLASGISLYPTVSNGEFKINSKSNLGKVNLQIFNLNGQSVYVKDLELNGNTAQDVRLNVSSGVYLAKFTEGAITTTKSLL